MNRFKISMPVLLVLVPSLFSCTKSKEFLVLSDPGRVAESVYMTQDANGNPVAVWLETDTTKNKNFLFYSVSTDNGETFTDKIQVPVPDKISSHAEGMPKVAFLKNGDVIAAFEKSAPTPENKYAGAVYYQYSSDDGQSWTAPKFLHSDTVAGRSRSYFDIATLPDGNVGACWLDVKSDDHEKGRSIRFAKTNARGQFVNEKVIEPFACECCRTDLTVGPDGEVAVAYRSVRKGNLNQLIRDLAWVKSSDGGDTFSAPEIISNDNWVMDRCPHTGPSLTYTTAGLEATWFTEGGGKGVYCSGVQNGSFVRRELLNADAVHPQMASNSTSTIMVFEVLVGDQQNIVYQVRNAEGFSGGNLTPHHSAYFPVVAPAGAKDYCIAFLGGRGKERHVFVKKLYL